MNREAISKQAVRQVLKEYAHQYTKHLLYSFGAFSLPAIGSILVFFVPPLIVAQLVNMVAAGQTLSIVSTGWYTALFGGSWLLGEGFWRLGIHLVIKLETGGMNELANSAFRHLTERDYDFYSNNFVGSLTKKAFAFSRGFEAFTDTLVFNVVTNVFPIIFAVIILSQYSLWLPTILIVSIVVVILVALPIIRRRSRFVAERHAAASRVSGDMSDVITNILAVKSFAKEEEEQQSFSIDVEDYTTKFKKAADYQNLRFDLLVSPLYVMANVVGLIATIYLAGSLGLQAGTMLVVFSYYAQVTRVFWETNRVYRNIESSISEASEFTQLILTPTAIQDSTHASMLSLSNLDIEFRDASFKYDGAEAGELFLDFNLKIKEGERVGLVGPSGGGKTTITKLLLRFIELESGTIMIGDQEIRNVSQKSLRETIAYVPQEPLLFHRSLFENIAYANKRATESDVIAAAKLARADEFINELPFKYQTLVGERGIKLSGGQRQRVAIARALLKDAPILVLDEATSSLDSESEKYIQEGLWELMKNKTAIVIAHRLSTIKHLDRILVLEQGKIVEDGTHDELVARKGLYAKLWDHQSGGFLED